MTQEQTERLATKLRDIYCPSIRVEAIEGRDSMCRFKWCSEGIKPKELFIAIDDGDFIYDIEGIYDRLMPHPGEYPMVLYAILHEIGHAMTITAELDRLDKIPQNGQMYGKADNKTHHTFPSEKAADDWMINTINSNRSGLLYMCQEIERPELFEEVEG